MPSISDLPITLSTTDSLNTFIIHTSADSNDGDYIYSTTYYDINEFARAIPAIRLIDRIDGWGDYVSSRHPCPPIPEELEDYLRDLIPYSEHGCHSICVESIQFIDANGVIHNVALNDE